MQHPKIVKVMPLENYTLKLEYETGECKLFNVLPYISGSWFEELLETGYFNTVHIVPGGQGIAWEHGQDIAPHELYEISTAAS